jgi:hypothetical protein
MLHDSVTCSKSQHRGRLRPNRSIGMRGQYFESCLLGDLLGEYLNLALKLNFYQMFRRQSDSG